MQEVQTPKTEPKKHEYLGVSHGDSISKPSKIVAQILITIQIIYL